MENKQVICVNAIKCKSCNQEITSYFVHDFKMCKCGKVGVDGGREYLKRIGDVGDYEELAMVIKPLK